ncbi:MAG TPA: hypothetical protein VFP49_08920, partial [Nitrososphaeraceae archaeon]|nr:hypothetical protein [Nitrososphaeraceae archaeon]
MENKLTTTTINTNKLFKKGKKYNGDIQQSKLLIRYIKNIQVMNKRTADEYYNRLSIFEKFILSQYTITIDEFINDLLQSKFDPYEVLGNYCIYLQEKGIQTSTLKNRVITVKNFLEFNDVDIR